MLKHLRIILVSMSILLAMLPTSIMAVSSTNFYQKGTEVFDDWNLCRTRAMGKDGFFQVYSETEFYPAITGESLGENADKAYQIGQQFAKDYPDIHQREEKIAEKIFVFVRDKVKYTSDAEQFGFQEFAQNADELITIIENKGFARGDCEDYAILLAVMYKGAGFRSAIVVASDHAAALVYLPGYKKANQSLSINGDSGWIWAEATGGNNPLGWMPERYIGKQLGAYEIEDKSISKVESSDKSSTIIVPRNSRAGIHISPFFSVIAVMWFLSLFRRRH